MLHTIVPLEHIIEQEEIQAPEEIEFQGLKMEVQPIDRYQARVVRILSANPQDYLNPAFAPGQMIDFRSAHLFPS